MLQGQSDDLILELCESINVPPSDFDDEYFSDYMLRLATEGYTSAPDADSARVAKRTQAYLEQYQDCSPKLGDIRRDVQSQLQ